MRLLLLDNHDSFTWNLAALLRRQDKVTFNIITPENLELETVAHFDRIIFSPGPGLPQEHQMMDTILSRFGETIPILGVCLGLQAIAMHYGAKLLNLPRVVHGQPKHLYLNEPFHYLFKDIPDKAQIGLYHSWAVDPFSVPECLRILAWSEEGTVMALEHREWDVCGVQFHPESILTPLGEKIIRNWIRDQE